MLAAPSIASSQSPGQGKAVVKGRLKQSVCRWRYAKIPLNDFFKAVADMGLTAVDLLTEKEWPIAAEHGLICSMGSGAGGGINDGLNVKGNHDKIVASLERAIPIAATAKVPNLITFFGNRRGMADEEATANCVEGLNRDQEGRRGSRHHDLPRAPQQQGRSQGLPGRPLGVRRRRGQGGRLTAREAALRHLPYADHGRRPDPHHSRQPRVHRALPYRRRARPPRARRHPGDPLAILATAIVDMGFQGYFAHEFIPVRDPLPSLREAVVLCDV